MAQPVSGNAGLVKTGAGVLTLRPANATSAYTGGTTVQAGGLTFVGGLVTDQITVMNSGTLRLSGTPVYSRLTVQSGGALDTVYRSAGLTNAGELFLEGGVVYGGDRLTNTGQMQARGTIEGVLANKMNVALTGALSTSETLNTGSIALGGFTLTSFSGLTNSDGGQISGKGTLAATLYNTGGTVRANGGGTLAVQSVGGQQDNSRLIVDAGSMLSVGNTFANLAFVTLNGGVLQASFTNNGLVQGWGQVNGNVTNQSGGTVNASGGVLQLSNGVTNPVEATLAVQPGATMRLSSALSSAGKITVDSGRFEIAAGGLTNTSTGRIEVGGSNSTIATTGLVNSGALVVSAASLRVDGNLSNSVTTTITKSTAQFYGAVTNSRTFNSTQSTLSFLGGLVNTGTFKTDPNRTVLSSLVNDGAGAIVAAAGDVFVVTGNVGGNTTNRTVWNTAAATLEFAAGTSSTHQFELSGVDLGNGPAAAASNFAWGTLRLGVGQKLSLKDAAANWSGGSRALYVGVLQTDGFAGGGVGSFVAGQIAGNGFNL